MQSELLIIRLKCGKAKQRLKNGTGWTSSLSPCIRLDSSAPDDCAIGPVALGSACGRGAAYRPSPPQPRQPLGGELHSGCKILSGGYISAMKYGCEPRVCACICTRLTGGQRSLCRQRLGGSPELGKQQQCLLLTPHPMSCSLCSSSSSPSSFSQCYCSLRADSMQGAMWPVSVLSSGLSTVCVRRKVGSLSTRSGGNEKPN